jgi:hypothetical protein
MLLKLLQEKKREEPLHNLFNDSSIILMAKPN